MTARPLSEKMRAAMENGTANTNATEAPARIAATSQRDEIGRSDVELMATGVPPNNRGAEVPSFQGSRCRADPWSFSSRQAH
jgi:hypothetical protein